MKTPHKDPRINSFVEEIIVLETNDSGIHSLPFYADGFPGLMYSETKLGVYLLPVNKILPNFFLYGQTIEPISLEIEGPYKLIVFQLYPFATRLLLNINPKEINDTCYDLSEVKHVNTSSTIDQLKNASTNEQVEIIIEYVLKLVRHSSNDPDNSIKLAVSTIIKSKGHIGITQLRNQLFITERTFERRFKKEIGVTPKQFSRIIQFSYSLNQIQESDFQKMTHIAYENGFTDQSHFIKSFKQFTGATPKELLSKLG